MSRFLIEVDPDLEPMAGYKQGMFMKRNVYSTSDYQLLVIDECI